MSTSVLTSPKPDHRRSITLRYEPRGSARTVFERRDPELVMSGPAGTGKSRALLEKLHLQACLYPGMRGLMVRKTHASLTATALVTYQEKILHPLDGVAYFGGNAVEPPQFRYPNGSRLVVGGLDKSSKVMSAEYDVIYVNECTELTESDWESLTTRLRNGKMPYQQIMGDCNPDAPSHWLKQRADSGQTAMLESRHEDNPSITQDYMDKLDALTGVRRLRLRLGIWAAAEGMVYEGWDRAVHLLDWQEIPASWPRYWVVDFGFTNPFCWQEWAEDPDGRLYRIREIYRSQRLVEDHAADILRLHHAVMHKQPNGWWLEWPGDVPRPRAIICDHDAEDRATLERHLGMKTTAAYKAVSSGIQAVASRLKKAGDEKPRLFLMRDALVERDLELADAKKPMCTEEEIESYVWDTSAGRKRGEEPLKKDDHGMDCARYLVAHVDRIGRGSNKLVIV